MLKQQLSATIPDHDFGLGDNSWVAIGEILFLDRRTFLSIHKHIHADLLDEFRVKKADSVLSLVGQLVRDDFFATVTSLICFNLCCLLILRV